jgi:hypothetical protein
MNFLYSSTPQKNMYSIRNLLFLIILFATAFFSCKKNEVAIDSSKSGIRYHLKSGTELVKKVIPLKEGGFLFVGELQGDGFAFAVDKNGNEIFYKVIGGDKHDIFYDATETTDEGFVLVGKSRSNSFGDYDGYVVKLSSSGEILWEKLYGLDRVDDLYSVIEDPDGNIIVAGNQVRAIMDTWIMKLDPVGNELWSTENSIGQYIDRGKSIAISPNGDYVLAGFNSKSNLLDEIREYQTNISVYGKEDGQILSVRIFDDYTRYVNNNAEGPNITLLSEADGYTWFTTFRTGWNVDQIQMVKISSSGSVEFEKKYKGLGNATIGNVVKVSGGGYLVTGSTIEDNGSVLSSSKCMLLRLDDNGNELWSSYFGKSEPQHIGGSAYYSENEWNVSGNVRNGINGNVMFLQYITDHNGVLKDEK